MKLLTFYDQGLHKLGVKTEQGILDITASVKNGINFDIKTDIMDVISGFKEEVSKLQDLIDYSISENKAVFVNEDEITWGPCVTRPHKIICVGLNYRKHADETNAPYPEVPILFNKFDNTLTGHRDEIPVPKVTEKLDYEVELGIVIGKKAKYVNIDKSLDHVFGYCTVNDLSARDLQLRTPQWLLGKSCDKFSPIGPFLVTADEVGDPNNLSLKTYVNGELRQDSNTSDMIFNCAEIVSYISQHMTLEPGDIILTGTPEGVVMGYPEDEQHYLQPGDVVTVEIEKLGALTNYFIEE
ncbi:fumarylacetoacetate hydrolase family protein [Lederbergia wuyishanensis]|uniref:2-keto-4-pentenoate hydratase/2-oxohepta-3-ene-1,7-dioic acid hydratase in catechol pathway n=1 Tax=Lederbergia wuyishanensis TaxID=1347903 RepID=A0ABU0D9F4_9BACI|nr:fumarylacetoacetate hydrolase family protein [Lederbergia wuyishanensis]MCJ8007524.1 fumarylacetoacetate hydrolase family protein [Lederbergia wuyishanensis]MDQ0345036.1 2-keto-4-pentenoate hydratase/2-oxohepta-3-ene-1,7-dioic acid hydratase in catechol pathway [Lederbergia wuyishanensis]